MSSPKKFPRKQKNTQKVSKTSTAKEKKYNLKEKYVCGWMGGWVGEPF